MPVNSNVASVGVINGTSVPVVLSLLNAARDGTGTLTPLITAGANGALINRVQATSMVAAAAVSTLQVLRLWRTSGAVKVLESEVLLPSATPNTGVLGSIVTFPKTNITIKAGEILSVTQTVSESVGYIADQGGDF
jgi:hypothetical protein